MRREHDEPRYTIKMVTPDHLNYAMLTGEGLPEGEYPVMNFKNNRPGLAAARKVKAGDQAIVYIAHRKGFIWSIEYLGEAYPKFDEQGQSVSSDDWDHAAWLVAPIRFLARRDARALVTLDEVEQRTGFLFKPNSFPEKEIDAETHAAIAALLAEAPSATGDGVIDENKGNGADTQNASHPTRDPSHDTPDLMAPSVPHPKPAPSPRVREMTQLLSDLLPQIRGAVDMPERHVEDLVKQILMRLGVPSQSVRFQVGRMDICVVDQQEQSLLVAEVKRSLTKRSTCDQARRQGFDYAMRSGSRHVLLTDARVFMLYDRSRGASYEDAFVGKAAITDLDEEGVIVLERLVNVGEACQTHTA
ncbi:MAG: hypothetical protein ACOC0P_02800 [Planctomycetota bacterium]